MIVIVGVLQHPLPPGLPLEHVQGSHPLGLGKVTLCTTQQKQQVVCRSLTLVQVTRAGARLTTEVDPVILVLLQPL